MIDLTGLAIILIQGVLGVLGIIVTGFLIPFVKQKLTAAQYDYAKKVVAEVVKAAEQMFAMPGNGDNKLEYVEQRLKEYGFKVDTPEIIALIESAVYSVQPKTQLSLTSQVNLDEVN